MTHLLEKYESNLINPILRGLSIYRWNTFPRAREITILDHLTFVAHISMIISYELEHGGDLIDRKKLLLKILYSGFFTFEYSDINSEVKYRLSESHPHLYQLLESRVYDALDASIDSSLLKEDLAYCRESSQEDDLIAYAKLWASYYEAYNNSYLYPEAYAKLLQSIQKRSLQPRFEKYRSILDIDPHHHGQGDHFLLVIHRLASSYRWNRLHRSHPVSVLSHTYIITFLTYLLAREERIADEALEDMLMTALCHDIPEAITGDIITPTKKAVPGLEDAIESIEADLVETHLLSYLEGSLYQDLYRDKMLHPWKQEF